MQDQGANRSYVVHVDGGLNITVVGP